MNSLSHKISTPTGTPVPDEKVKELSSNDVIGGNKGGRESKSPDFEGMSFMDAPLENL